MKKQKIDRGIYRKIFGYLKPYLPLVICTIALSLVSVAGQLAVPYFVGKAIDQLIGAGEVNYAELYKLFIIIGGCIAGAAVAQYVQSLLNNRTAYHILADVRRDAFRKIERLPLKYIDSRAYGEISSVIISDAEQFADGLLLGFTQLFTGVFSILGVLVIMLVMRWEIALVVFFITPLSLFAARFIASRSYSMFKKQSEVRAEQTAFIDEVIGNLKTVKALTHEQENEEAFAEKNEEMRKTSLRAVFFSSTTNPVTRFINSLVYAAVLLTGAIFVINTGGAFSVGNLTTFLSYSTQYTKPFNEISEVVAEFQNALACGARLFAIIAEEEEPSDKGNLSPEKVHGDVTLENVDFSYTEGQRLIENLSVTAKAGQRVAIVGPTGCGKTTVINLLMRFYDVKGGSVKVDGIDIRDMTRKSLRENVGMVLQETWLKTGTVRENLCLGAPDCTEEEMIAAAKAAHAHSFIERLPEGYDTEIGGEGTLSQGQKQLLCIARVMLCRPPMLILDEATSNIDTRTERIVQDAFAKLMQGRTCFIVAHRLSTIQSADMILVMNAGHIVEQGTHKELLKKGGFYQKLYEAQYG